MKKPFPKSYPSYKDKTLGAYLKRKRLDLKWTRVACARFFEVSLDTYRNWEWNWFIPELKYKKKVIEFLNFNFWDDKTNSLSNKCLLYRIEHGLTQLQLAEKTRVAKTTIYRIEKGLVSLSKKNITKFENFLQ